MKSTGLPQDASQLYYWLLIFGLAEQCFLLALSNQGFFFLVCENEASYWLLKKLIEIKAPCQCKEHEKTQDSLCDVETATLMANSFATTRPPSVRLLWKDSKMTVKFNVLVPLLSAWRASIESTWICKKKKKLHIVLYQEVIGSFWFSLLFWECIFALASYWRALHAERMFTCNQPRCRLPLQAILLSSDGHNLVTGGDNGVVQVWQACDFKQLYVYPGCDAGVRAMDLSHDQRWEQPEGLTHHRPCRGEQSEAKHHRWGRSQQADKQLVFFCFTCKSSWF